MDKVYAALSRIPLFRGVRREALEFRRLSGALTNASYKITAAGGAYVLRLAGEGTSEYVDRAAEEHNARIAAAAGINAEVLYFDARDGTMLSRFIEGVTMNGAGFDRDPESPARVALALRRVHRLGRAFRFRFDVFAMIDHYLGLLNELRIPPPEDYRDIGWEVQALRRTLEASPVHLAPCHNDPWPGNLLDAGGRVYVIDWEYSGMNDPMWDLGDFSVEAGFGPERDRVMMEAYYGAAAAPAYYSRLALYKSLSDLHWALWALLQHANGNPADDFRAYALERLERCKTRLGSPDFSRHLDVVYAGRRSRTSRHTYRTTPERKAPIRKATETLKRTASPPPST